MSLWNSVLSDTIGVLYRAKTGNVDPWTYANIQEQTDADIQKAGSGLPQEVTDYQKSQAQSNINTVLDMNSANPYGVGCSGFNLPIFGCVNGDNFLPKVDTAVNIALALVAVGIVAYVGFGIRRALR